MTCPAYDLPKQTLLSTISSLSERRSLFFSNPDSDFTRVKKISFDQTILFPIIAGKENTATELIDFFNEGKIPFPSAMIQRRNQIKPEAFITLFREFIGRIPVVVALDSLDEDALIKILTQPKNAIIKQYKSLFKMDDVELEFTEDAVQAIAKKSFERNTGARGLRAILESVMTDVMFNIPSDETIEKCVITKEAVEGAGQPILEYRNNTKEKKAQ